MTTTELLVGTFVLIFTLAMAFWFGVFVGLEISRRRRRKELLNQALEDKQND